MRWRLPSLAWFVVSTAALVVVLPLILHGCSCGHDFDFHLVSWFEAAAQFRGGNLHPAWAFSPAWNAGEPRFVFYPPLSWTLGGLLGIVMPWAAVPVAYTWIALVAAGAGMYRLAREFASEQAATFAAAIYIANPYMMFTAYERTAYAELLAAAWIPLLLAGVLRERVTVLRVAIPVALLWLTNAPAAVMGCYALGMLAAIRLVLSLWRPTHRDRTAMNGARNSALPVFVGVALGLGLAAFYVVPAAYERRWVQIGMATLQGMDIWDNFLFQKIGDVPHDEVLYTASAIAVTMVVAAMIGLSVAFVRSRRHTRTLSSLAVLMAAIAFMLTPLSAVVWRTLPEISFLQFPWRLVAVLAAVAAVAVGLAFDGIRAKPFTLAVGSVFLVAAVSLPTAAHFRQGCDDEDTVSARLAVFQARSGSEPTDEYTPADADNDSLAHGRPSFWLSESGMDEPAPGLAAISPVQQHLSVAVPQAEVLVLNLRAYPAWLVRVNGSVVATRIHRADGLIAMPVQAGVDSVDVSYQRTSDQQAGSAISLVSLFAALGLMATKRRSRIIES